MRSRKTRVPPGQRAPKSGGLAAEAENLRAALVAAQRRIKELERRADEDALVPLLNRRGFIRELERALAYARRYGAKASLVYLDLDDFKLINDTFGHAAGDKVLEGVARLLLDNVRSSDVVGRLGGDEFAIVLWNTEGAPAEAKVCALAGMIAAASFAAVKGKVKLTASHGVTALNANDTADTALMRADNAMYAGKNATRRR
jgi:diguanylate cyclase (GGDEF)-like protein